MGLDLLGIQPHKVSRDLSGYITYIYGAPKTGKTTLATQMPDALLLAFENGYRALPGVKAVDILSWTKMKEVLRELKKPEVQEFYKCIIVDTVDIAADMCSKYICNQLGIENMGDGGWSTNSWKKFKAEFNDVFRTLAQLGYAVFFLGHHKEEKDESKGAMTIRPSLSPSSCAQVIEGMADIFGYSHQVGGHGMSVLTLRHPDDTILCGGRFKYIAPEIEMTYENLVNALHEAIDKEAAEHNNEFVTDEKAAVMADKEVYDFDALKKEFEELIGILMNKNQTYYAPRITTIIDKYLGKGKKVSDATPQQAEFIYLIVNEIKDEFMN